MTVLELINDNPESAFDVSTVAAAVREKHDLPDDSPATRSSVTYVRGNVDDDYLDVDEIPGARAARWCGWIETAITRSSSTSCVGDGNGGISPIRCWRIEVVSWS